jgi:hypothetical protein
MIITLDWVVTMLDWVRYYGLGGYYTRLGWFIMLDWVVILLDWGVNYAGLGVYYSGLGWLLVLDTISYWTRTVWRGGGGGGIICFKLEGNEGCVCVWRILSL